MNCEDGKCPICKSDRPKEVIDYVLSELEKFAKNPNYEMKHWSRE